MKVSENENAGVTTEIKLSAEEIALLNQTNEEKVPSNRQVAPDKDFFEFLKEGYELLKEENPEFARF